MTTNTNNIISYFIKDITDPIEMAYYKGFRTKKTIKIFYKDKLIYDIDFKYIRNYKKNIIKSVYSYGNYKLYLYKNEKCKYLYYKNDKKVLIYNYNYIKYTYKQNKYLKKKGIDYSIDNTFIIYIRLFYYKGYKYHFKYKQLVHKFTHSQILIVNKYELHYYNRFFNLYFVINY